MGYIISSVRFKDEKYEEIIDKLLISCYEDNEYEKAVDDLERFMTDSRSFTEKFIKHCMKHLRRKNTKRTLNKYGVYTGNLHNYLGPGGYVLEKVRYEEP